MEFHRLGNGQQVGEIDRPFRHPRRDVLGVIDKIAEGRLDIGQPAFADVHRPGAKRRAGPFVHRPAGEIRAQVIQLEVQAGDAMGDVHDGVHAARPRHGDDLAHRRHQPGAVGDLGQQQQLGPRRFPEHLVIGSQDIGGGGRLRHGELDQVRAAPVFQPLHRRQGGVIVQVAADDAVARCQRLVVDDQHLQRVRAATGDGDLFGGAADLPGDRGLGGVGVKAQIIGRRQDAAAEQRIVVVHQDIIAGKVLGNDARHGAPIAGFQIVNLLCQVILIRKIAHRDRIGREYGRRSGCRRCHRRGQQGRADGGGFQELAAVGGHGDLAISTRLCRGHSALVTPLCAACRRRESSRSISRSMRRRASSPISPRA